MELSFEADALRHCASARNIWESIVRLMEVVKYLLNCCQMEVSSKVYYHVARQVKIIQKWKDVS